MFALAAARDLVIAIVMAIVLGTTLGWLGDRAARHQPTIYSSGDGCRALSLDECRAAFYSAGAR